jgi:hypothetical protein
MAQYVVAPEVLAPYLPGGVELDLYQGRCYVSLVGFLFDKVRVKGIAIPRHTRFEEINLRFYVRRHEGDGSVRRGVVFVREFVPRRAIAWVAKRFYEEPYLAIPTRHAISNSEGSLSVRYEWELGGRWHSLGGVASAQPEHIAAGSEQEFITEHYWGYTKRSDGRTAAYRVEHPRWRTYPLQSYQVDVDFKGLYGSTFAFLNGKQESSVLLAEGSEVTVHSGFRLP